MLNKYDSMASGGKVWHLCLKIKKKVSKYIYSTNVLSTASEARILS